MNLDLLTGLVVMLGAFVVRDLVGVMIRGRLRRADDADRAVWAEVIRRVDENQRTLAERLTEDRAQAAREFERVGKQLSILEHRLTRLEVHHGHNHPGQLPP